MPRPPANPNKRGRPDSTALINTLSEAERKLYELIKNKKEMGVGTFDMKRGTGLQEAVITKSLKSLQSRNLIKAVVNVNNKGRKHYMSVEFEPSKEITGGSWYAEGKLDIQFIEVLKEQCLKYIHKIKVITIEGISEFIRRSGILKIECSVQQITEIIQSLVLDNEVEEVRSNGSDEFSSVPIGRVCYRPTSGNIAKKGVMASIPCGVCPRISDCTPDGIISPTTCEYYKKWLEF